MCYNIITKKQKEGKSMELTNFEKVCIGYNKGLVLKQSCEKVYNTLKASGKEMTATEIAESVKSELKYRPSVQFVNACIQKLRKLNLVTRREIITDKKITIDPKNTRYGFMLKGYYTEVFDQHGKSLGVQLVKRATQEPFEINEKKALFSVKNA